MHAVEFALQHPLIDEVFVSTDDREIANIAAPVGANVIDRPVELASDTSPEWLAWQHAIATVRQTAVFDRFISLPCTAPFRSNIDVTRYA